MQVISGGIAAYVVHALINPPVVVYARKKRQTSDHSQDSTDIEFLVSINIFSQKENKNQYSYTNMVKNCITYN